MDEVEVAKKVSPEMEQTAAERARLSAKAARWDLDVAVFFFAVLTIDIILLFQGIGLEFMAPATAVGLALGWLMGWRKGKQAYEHFYEQELAILQQQSSKSVEDAMEETIDERVRKALRERLR